MSNLNLTRLWYIFPPDDQELRPRQFRSKVRSYVGALPNDEKLAVLDFLIVQYSAFEQQLDIMRAGAALAPSEHRQRAQNLSQHLETLIDCRRNVQSESTRACKQRDIGRSHKIAPAHFWEETMQRRTFLKKSALSAAAGAVAAPAIAQSLPKLQWRFAASWPKSLDVGFGAAELIAKRVGELTEGRFQIRVFASGEIVPALQVLDAVQAGTVEMGHTALYYYFGKDPAFAFGTSTPFGMTTRQNQAWWYFGGGAEALAPLLSEYGCIGIPSGNTGCQMGGWFRREINSVADLKGLKMRIGGMAGLVLAKLGAVPQMIAASDIYPALEKGTDRCGRVGGAIRRREARLR